MLNNGLKFISKFSRGFYEISTRQSRGKYETILDNTRGFYETDTRQSRILPIPIYTLYISRDLYFLHFFMKKNLHNSNIFRTFARFFVSWEQSVPYRPRTE